MKNIVQFSLIAFLIALAPLSMATGITINKYIPYAFVSAITLMSLLFFRRGNMQVLTMLTLALIVQKVFIYRTYVAEIIPIDVVVMFIVLSYLSNVSYADRKYKTQVNIKLSAVLFLFLSVISSTMSFLSGGDVVAEIKAFQVYVVWGLLMFMYGIQLTKLPEFSQLNVERSFSVITVCVSFLHLFAVFTGTNIEDVRSDGAFSNINAASYFRYGGLFSNVNIQSAYMVGGMAFGMFLYVRKSSSQDKILGASAFVLGLTSCVISGSRMAFLSSTLLIVLFIIYQRKRIKEIAHFLIGICIAILFLGAMKASTIITYFNRSIERIGSKGGGDQRSEIWKCTVDLISENPIGMGINYDQFWMKIEPCLGGGVANPHNTILGFGVHLGVLGILLITVYLAIIIKSMISIIFVGQKNENASNLFFLSVVFMFGLTEAFIFDLQKLHLIYFFVIGLSVGQMTISKNNLKYLTKKLKV